MEELPGVDVLPSPGFPEMPPAGGPRSSDQGDRDLDAGRVANGGGEEVLDGPHASPWPRPLLAGEDPEYRAPIGDPYQTGRAPGKAPPMHGRAVPRPDLRSPAMPLGAPPALIHEPGGDVAAPAREVPGAAPAEVPPPGLPSAGQRAAPGNALRRTVHLATGLLRIGDAAAQPRRQDLVSRVRAPVAGGHHRVAVLSLKGGVGKTTVTVGLGATLASLRDDRVIAVDANPDRGTLSDKVRLETTATVRDLVNERAHVGRYADMRSFTSQSSSRLEVLASDRDPGISVAFSSDDYRAIARLLEAYYAISVTDCGTGLLNSPMAGILELTDQIVVVCSPSVDGARSASATLDWLAAHGYRHLVRHGVVALSPVRRKSKTALDLDRLEQHFAARCRAVARIPFDPHLEEGAEVELDRLSAETADAYLELAALVADGFAAGRSASDRAARLPLA